MQIRRLKIDNHKCLVDFEINFETKDGGSSTILIGENGTGKSTMLETVLEILMSFDSPSIEKSIEYNYLIEYEYAQCLYSIVKEGHHYCITTPDETCRGNYKKARSFVLQRNIFPRRVIAFYSGANNKISKKFTTVNNYYSRMCKNTLGKFLKAMHGDTELFLPNFPERKYNYCDEEFTPIYLASIMCGHNTFEKEYFTKACNFERVECIDMIINVDMVERAFGRGRFVGDIPTGLYYFTDFIDYRFTEILRRGFLYTSMGKSVFEIKEISSIEVDSIAILDFFEKLHTLFDAKFEVTVTHGASSVKSSNMSEGQRQLIKILGMLGICKTQDCLVLMDEPDSHMNPKWKYEIKDTIDKSLQTAVNTQAIIATHDPLVINGVEKEFIRIFTQNQAAAQYNNMYITKVIEPSEDTTGMGIDGLLQSEYYGMPSVLDTNTREKLHEKYDLVVKKQEQRLDENEAARLKALTEELESMIFARNMPTDEYYDEFVAAMHKIYRDNRAENLTAEAIEERNTKAEEILREIFGI